MVEGKLVLGRGDGRGPRIECCQLGDTSQRDYLRYEHQEIEEGTADYILSSALRTATEEELTRNRVPGAQVVLRRNEEVLWSACFGRLKLAARRDAEATDDNQHVKLNDRFVIASVTKLVVACVAMSLVECGELNLDETVDRWLPELPNAGRITLRMLLSHGSGLGEYGCDDWLRRQYKDNYSRTWTRREVLNAIVRLGPEAEPGERFTYTNSNYIVIGEILELSTGKSIGTLVEEYIRRPLGLGTLSFSEEQPGGGRLAAPYEWLSFRRHNPYDALRHMGWRIPGDALGEEWTDGGIMASAEDLAVFTEALFSGRLLRAQTVEEMSTPPGYGETLIRRMLRLVSPGESENAYGLGVAIERQGDSSLLWHDGMYLGWTSATTYDTRSRVTVTVLTNLAGRTAPAQRLEKRLRAVLA